MQTRLETQVGGTNATITDLWKGLFPKLGLMDRRDGAALIAELILAAIVPLFVYVIALGLQQRANKIDQQAVYRGLSPGQSTSGWIDTSRRRIPYNHAILHCCFVFIIDIYTLNNSLTWHVTEGRTVNIIMVFGHFIIWMLVHHTNCVFLDIGTPAYHVAMITALLSRLVFMFGAFDGNTRALSVVMGLFFYLYHTSVLYRHFEEFNKNVREARKLPQLRDGARQYPWRWVRHQFTFFFSKHASRLRHSLLATGLLQLMYVCFVVPSHAYHNKYGSVLFETSMWFVLNVCIFFHYIQLWTKITASSDLAAGFRITNPAQPVFPMQSVISHTEHVQGTPVILRSSVTSSSSQAILHDDSTETKI